MKKKIALSLCLAIAPTLITLLSSLTQSVISSSLHPLIPSSLSAQIPSEGLVAWYPFNGNANDESGNGNNGTVNGATLTTDRNGNLNEAYHFNGSQQTILVANSTSLSSMSEMTFSCWVNPESWFSNPTWGTLYFPIVCKSNTSSLGGLFSIFLQPNSFYAYFDGYQTGSSTGSLLGTWVNLTVTVSPTYYMRFFIDGQLVSESQSSYVAFPNNSNLDLVIGGDIPGQAEYAIGKIDNIAIYNRVLSASEIQQLYQDQTGQVQQPLTCSITAPVTSICEGETITLSMNTTGGAGSSSQLPANLQQGLVAYYPFNGNVQDQSAFHNDLTGMGHLFSTDRNGVLNNSVYLSNDAYLFAANQVQLSEFDQGQTINFWFKILDFPSDGKEHFIISKGNGNGFYECFFSDYNDLNAFIYRFGVASNNYHPQGTGVSFSNIALNEWINFTLTTDLSAHRLYINGEFYMEQFLPSGIGTSTSGLYLGRNVLSNSSTGYFNGFIDDVAIYNRALSPSEIQQLYTAQSYAWNTGETTSSITVTPTANSTYSCTVTQGSQTCTASVDITVNPNVTNAISASITEGETYTLGTQTLTAAGTYTEVFTSEAGCDSTVTLTLAVEPLLTCNITAPVTSICEGESITLSMNTTGGAGASSQLPANLQQGLVAYYPFNGNANDESGNGNDGTVNGATLTADRNGKTSSAYDFNVNSGYIEVSNSSSLSNINALTVSVWFRVESYYYFSDFFQTFPILSKSNQSFHWGNFDLNLWQAGNLLQTHLLTKETGCSTDVAENSWNHLICSINNDSTYFYLNGLLICSGISGNFPQFSENHMPMFIGRNIQGGANEIADGQIDDIFIFNRFLSPYEIQQLYTAQYFDWNNGATTSSITVTPSTNSNYSCSVTSGSQTCTASVDITVNPQQTFYADNDADGFGDANNVVQDCNQPAGYVSNSSDCNDASSAINTAAQEICGNQMDDNCNGQVDENCAVLGCTNPSACNFDPLANTDDGSCILPQPEICDGLDNNCNNQIDEGLSPASISAVAATTALYPVCSGNSIKSANLNNGANSPAIEGNGNDLWYSFNAQFNTFRAGLSAATGDNDLRLFSMTAGGCLELIETEHESTNGNQTLLTDQLTVGQTYYVAVHNISGPMNTSAKICFNHLNASSCDHYYSNNTGIYTSVCSSFKAQYRANAVAYTFEILSATQNGVNQNITPWSYTTPTSSTVVARLGTLLPANQGISPIVYTMRVPVLYSLFDAAGSFENLYAQATATCTTTLNAQPTIALRNSDRCPISKSITSTIAPDRTVCGAMRYDWEFTQVLPTAGTAQVVQGGAYASAFFLSNIPGVATGKTYNVRVRPVHSSGVAGNWGTVQCLRIGNAGMILENHPVQTAQALVRTPLLSLRAGGEMNTSYSIYPNPTATGSFVLQYNEEGTGDEEVKELVMMDITGKVVCQQQVVLNGNAVEVQFGDLASGVYVVMVGEERLRLIVE